MVLKLAVMDRNEVSPCVGRRFVEFVCATFLLIISMCLWWMTLRVIRGVSPTFMVLRL